MGRFGWLRQASRSLALRSGEVQDKFYIPFLLFNISLFLDLNNIFLFLILVFVFISSTAACSSTCIYIGDNYYGRFMMTSSVLSRSFHATGHRCSIDKDYYKILGVPKDASQDDIKKAFHSTLRDPSKREQYDMVFQQDKNMRANDIKVELNLSFHEAANGCIKQVSFSAKNVCDSCGGRGHLENAKRYICPSCKGLGRVTNYPFTTTCSFCRGVGKVIKDYCFTCEGSGVVDGIKNVEVKLPAGAFLYFLFSAGIDSGDTIHVAGAGDSGGLGTQHGSLYIKIQVANDPMFTRDGADIHVDKKISFTQAMLGGKVEVPTLNGNIEVKIPKGVQPGQVVVLRGKGMRNLAGFFGDQYVRFQIHFPSVVTERQRVLLEEFAVEEATKEQNTSIVGNWWELVSEHMTGQKVMIGVGILLLIHTILSRAVS
nr:unnamed protein product [Digitaria exilis]